MRTVENAFAVSAGGYSSTCSWRDFGMRRDDLLLLWTLLRCRGYSTLPERWSGAACDWIGKSWVRGLTEHAAVTQSDLSCCSSHCNKGRPETGRFKRPRCNELFRVEVYERGKEGMKRIV